MFGMQKLQNSLIETEKTRKTQQKKQTFDAHQNPYIIGVHKNRFKNSKKNFKNIGFSSRN